MQEFMNSTFNASSQNSTISITVPIGTPWDDPDWFDVTVVPDQDVTVLPWARFPHVVMIGTSGEATIENFHRLYLGGNQTNHPHKGTSFITLVISKASTLQASGYRVGSMKGD